MGMSDRPYRGCTGTHDCPAERHTHGCHADDGNCDSPEDHHAPRRTTMPADRPDTVTAWGFEFRKRSSGSMPWEYRREGGCDHDWVMVGYDHPLVAALEASFPPPPDPWEGLADAMREAWKAAYIGDGDASYMAEIRAALDWLRSHPEAGLPGGLAYTGKTHLRDRPTFMLLPKDGDR